MQFFTKFMNYATAGMLLAAAPASGQTIYSGVMGPTPRQLEERLTLSRNELGVESAVNNLILKYWDGKQIGKWFFINMPYKRLEAAEGFGDLSLGGGPRFTLGNLHFFPYGGLTLRTGADMISAERTDVKAGTFLTYLSASKGFEADAALDYNFTGSGAKIDCPKEHIGKRVYVIVRKQD